MTEPVTPAEPATTTPEAPAVENPTTPVAPTQTPEEITATEEAARKAAEPQSIGDTDETTPTVPANQDGDTFTYDPTGDTALDVALSFVGNLGLGPEAPEVVAAGEGNFDLLSAKLATMGDKATGWQQMVDLAKGSFERTTQASQDLNTKVTAAVHSVAGDAQTWDTIKEWASQNADASEKEQINDMLNSGPVQARAAAQLLKQAYEAAPGNVVTPAPAIKATAQAGGPSQGTTPLTAKEYSAEVNKLVREEGSHNLQSNPKYAALQARRQAFRG